MTTIISTETLFDGWSKFLLAQVRLSDGSIVARQIEDHGRAVCVLPYDTERRCAILVRQFRAPVYYSAGQQDLLECIAGIVDEDDVAETARREAMEETGLRLSSVEHVGRMWSIPGISTERADLFLAAYRESDRVAAGGGLAQEHEDITVVEMALADLAAMADTGRLKDLKAFALIQTLRVRRPELFA